MRPAVEEVSNGHGSSTGTKPSTAQASEENCDGELSACLEIVACKSDVPTNLVFRNGACCSDAPASEILCNEACKTDALANGVLRNGIGNGDTALETGSGGSVLRDPQRGDKDKVLKLTFL